MVIKWLHPLRTMQRCRRSTFLAGLLVVLFLASVALPFASHPSDISSPQKTLPNLEFKLAAPPGDAPAIQWTNVSGPTGLGTWSGNFLSWADFDADGDQDLLVN